jgi:elongation factor P
MLIQSTSLRAGSKFEYEDDVWTVLSFQHRTPGKGQACMQIKARSLTTGAGREIRFNSNERVALADLEQRRMSYSYHDGHDYVFMDNETFDQIIFSEEELGDVRQYLIEGMEISVQYYKGKPVGIDIPTFLEMKVDQADPAVKGDTATNITKQVTLESGLKIQVPIFINAGDVLKIDTRDGSYVERVSKA